LIAEKLFCSVGGAEALRIECVELRDRCGVFRVSFHRWKYVGKSLLAAGCAKQAMGGTGVLLEWVVGS